MTGCNSNTLGFSNSVSDLLESVNKANQEPYEVVSSEDMLANTEIFNEQSKKVMEEGREHLVRKTGCGKEEIMKVVARCDKLWERKSKESRIAANTKRDDRAGEEEDLENLRQENSDRNFRAGEEEDLEDLRQESSANDRVDRAGEEENLDDLRHRECTEEENHCKEMKSEEIIKYRRHQYEQNPSMMITAEDIEEVMNCNPVAPV